MIDKAEIARRHGIPEQADQLVGTTAAECEADAAARAAIAQMFGRKTPEPDVERREVADLSDAELDEQTKVIEAERQRRREDAEAEAFGQALVGSMAKRRHQALIDELHP